MLESTEGRKKIASYIGKSPYKLTFDDYTAWKDDRKNIGRQGIYFCIHKHKTLQIEHGSADFWQNRAFSL